jgi:hypothetical protein
MIGCDALQSANGDRVVFDAAAATGGFTRTVADATENAGENVRFSIHHVCMGEFALRDQPNVLRNIGVRRASPLAVHYAVEVIGLRSIGRFHGSS